MYFCLKIFFLTLTNSVGPDKFSMMPHSDWIFAVCKITNLRVSQSQKVNNEKKKLILVK